MDPRTEARRRRKQLYGEVMMQGEPVSASKAYSALGADGRYVVDRLWPEWRDQFMRKARDYNHNENENHRQLGVMGQFADIWRKIGKLKKALWHGEPLEGEQPREILMDLIAHCFLTIAMLDALRMAEDPHKPYGVPIPTGPMIIRPGNVGLQITDMDTVQGKEYAGSKVTLQLNDDGALMVPSCGRVRCVQHVMVPLTELGDRLSHD